MDSGLENSQSDSNLFTFLRPGKGTYSCNIIMNSIMALLLQQNIINLINDKTGTRDRY